MRKGHSSRLRAAAVIACVALVVAVGVVTSLLIREPEPARMTPIDLPAASSSPSRRRATPTPAPGELRAADADDDEDDPFDDDD